MGKEVKCSICGKHLDVDYFDEHVLFYHKLEKVERPATKEDIVAENEIYILCDDGRKHLKYIEDVLRPSDPFKAFCATDGCRYGLDSAYIITYEGEIAYYSYIDPQYTSVQEKAVEQVKELNEHFPQRWFIQQEISGITLNTIKALLKKDFIEFKEVNTKIYYRMIEEEI